MTLGSGAEYGWNTIKQIQGDWANLYQKYVYEFSREVRWTY